MSKINKDLKAKIVAKFGSQFEFSRAARLHETNVSAVIRGRVKLGPDSRRRWAEILDAPEVEKLLEGKN